MNSILKSYLITALWSSNDFDGNPLDADYSIEHLSPEALAKSEAELDSFIARAEEMNLIDVTFDYTTVAHDFWLTRNGHGAGFWDGDYRDTNLGNVGDMLTCLAKSFKEVDLYVGDDGKLYL